jgi:hypothetical protein
MVKRSWTADEVRALGVRTTVEIAGSILGLSRTQAYEAVKRGDLETFTIGRRIVVPVAPLLHKLSIDDADETHDIPPAQLRAVT